MNDRLDAWQSQWPALFGALADPDEAMPPPMDGGLEQACASWGALHHALRCLLGWGDIAGGLAWWYRAGKPVTDSPVLALIQRTWGRGELIDYYAAWAWKPAGVGLLGPALSSTSESGPSPGWLAEHSRWPDEAWWRSFLRRGAVHERDPFYGGYDALHLAIHDGDDDGESSPGTRLFSDPASRRAVLVVDDIRGWYRDLKSCGGTLPASGERSWRIEVFDRRIGWLGEFRRSRVSGRWFTGKHSIHMQGNAPR